MQWILLVATLTISNLYFYYFWAVLKGQAKNFETEMMKQFSIWLMKQGETPKQHIWGFYIATLVLEFYILYLAFQVFASNLFMQFFTVAVFCFECCHYAMFTFNMVRFFNAKSSLSQLFNWPLERTAAMFLFTYCLIASIVNCRMFLM